ncbi:hypothetical protein C8J57DRAFT_1529957 [Mycena rebaudengoi]|nr:hypothetical protein C8J57DRAFT_1529957 [Mycena rebaudengoi]
MDDHWKLLGVLTNSIGTTSESHRWPPANLYAAPPIPTLHRNAPCGPTRPDSIPPQTLLHGPYYRVSAAALALSVPPASRRATLLPLRLPLRLPPPARSTPPPRLTRHRPPPNRPPTTTLPLHSTLPLPTRSLPPVTCPHTFTQSVPSGLHPLRPS